MCSWSAKHSPGPGAPGTPPPWQTTASARQAKFWPPLVETEMAVEFVAADGGVAPSLEGNPMRA